MSASAVVSRADPVHPLVFQVNGGYVKRLSPAATLDLGIIHSRYSRHSSVGAGLTLTELYVGMSHKFLTSRVYLSPHYFGPGEWTVYGEVDGHVAIGRNLGLHGHVGALVPAGDRQGGGRRARTGYDWRLGLQRQIGPASLHATLSGGNRGRDRGTLTFGIGLPL